MTSINNEWIFHDKTTTPQNGTEFMPNYADQMTIFITGTSTSRTIEFKGSDEDGNWYSIPAFKNPDFTLASSTTGNNEAWIVDLTGWVSVNVNVTAIDGGNVTVKAKVVNTVG
jgi:hypothetical protein